MNSTYLAILDAIALVWGLSATIAWIGERKKTSFLIQKSSILQRELIAKRAELRKMKGNNVISY